MKKVIVSGQAVQLVSDKTEMGKLNVSRAGANGLPASPFIVVPIIGQLSFKIGNDTYTPTGVGVFSKDTANKPQFRMVSINSFNRSARTEKERTDENGQVVNADNSADSTVMLLTGSEGNFALSPTEIITKYDGNVIKVESTPQFYFPKLEAGKPADWVNATKRTATVRIAEEDAKEFSDLKTEFKAFLSDTDNTALLDCVKLIDSDYLT